MNNPSLLEITLIGLLAVYRITFLLKAAGSGEGAEPGPGHVLDKIRTWIGVRYDEHTRPVATNWRAEVLLCFLCLSVWIAFGVVALIAIGLLTNRLDLVMVALLPFALSGGSIFLKKWAG